MIINYTIMNKTLYDLYLDVIRKGIWKYYPMSKIDASILQDSGLGRGFITNYLGKGEKNDMEIFHYINELDENRVLHIISVFFLGFLLYQNCEKVNREINRLIQTIPAETNEPPEERFKYIWMLICLFHDFGYAVEDGFIAFEKQDFEKYMKALPRKPKSIPDVYSKKLLKQYNKFRKCRFGKNDHGIVGGIKLFSDLCSLREEKEGTDRKHYWGKLLENDFCIASWTIACHNIYFINKSDRNIHCYRHFKLDKLVYNDQSRAIQINKAPFLFLFCLVDSIEPLKKVFDIKKLKDISLDFDKGSITLGYDKLCPVVYEDYKRTILNLNDWLTDISNDGTKISL